MMFDTMVTVVGNVLNTPQWRRIDDGQLLVTNFKVAATSRRYDRQTDQWVDGSSLRVRVNCWRRLAENVGACVTVGDPVMVVGRLYSRDWEGEDHVRRTSYEIDAVAVGHDLSKGRGRFTRQRLNLNTTSIEDDEAEARVRGSLSTPVDELNELPRERMYDEELGGYVTAVNAPTEYSSEYSSSGFSAVTSVGAYGGSLRADDADLDFAGTGADGESEDGAGDSGAETDGTGAEGEGGDGTDGEPRDEPGPRRRGRRVPVPA
jgi:single-strand DNA-binding protein